MKYRITHTACKFGCGSSDAYSEFFGEEQKWVGRCFSCGEQRYLDEISKPMKRTELVLTDDLIDGYREIPYKTLKKYGVGKFVDDKHGTAIVYSYGDNSQKFRFKDKVFQWINYPNDGQTLFGSNVFPKGGRAITITEGENDAMAVYTMMGDYPVVSLKNGADSAKKLTPDDFEYMNSFDSIVVCFDNDKPGKKAIEEFCSLFPAKVKIVDFPKGVKDAHEMLVNGDKEKFRERWWKAKVWSPSNIVFPIDILDDILSPHVHTVIPYPWNELNKQIFGLHTPELITLSAEPKVGKSLITGAIVHHIHESTGEVVADVTVENTPDERNLTLLSLKCKKPLHLRHREGINLGITEAEIRKVGEDYFADRRIISFERDGITNVNQIFDKINYMVEVLGCKYVVFDHINYAASYHEQDERKALDAVSNRLADLAKDKRICLIVVSHENDDGKLFGSRNLLKSSHTVIRLSRDRKNPDPDIRNITTLTVTESRRYGSRIGVPIYLKYDESRYQLTEMDREVAEDILGGRVETEENDADT